MALFSGREAVILAGLKKSARGGKAKVAVADMFNLARQAAAESEHATAAMHYAALADYTPQNQNLPMRAARSYHKASQSQDAARWYLEAAERYALMHQSTQAIATLRLYHEVAPGEHRGPKRIFNICREQGSTGSGVFEFLSFKDKATYSLRAENIFSAFDDSTFATALDAMTGRQLQQGEVLTHTGDKAESIYLIVRGRVEAFLTLSGQRTYIGCFDQGDICSVIPYFTGGRRSADMIASKATELLELPYSILDSLRQKSPEFSDQIETLYNSHILTKQLALTPLFRKLDAALRNEVTRHMHMQTIQAGEIIFQEGETGNDLYLIRSGTVAINLNIKQQEKLFKTLKAGAFIGEISVATKGRCSSTARAISDCQVAKLDGEVYQRLFDKHAMLRQALERRKKHQLDSTREYVRQLSMVEGDDTRELLLKDIWGQ